MSQQRSAETRADDLGAAADAGSGKATVSAPASGIVRRDELEAEIFDEAPPWTVVNAFLTSGEHRAWVEAHARCSRAFAEVLEALRNDQEARRQEELHKVHPFRRRQPKS